MPSVNKKFLREEIELLKGEFERLSNEGKVNSEISALCQSMIMLFELLIAVFYGEENQEKQPKFQ